MDLSKGLAALGVALTMTFAQSARAEDPDTVMLASGGLVRGMVVEEDPLKGVSVRLADGTVRKIPPNELKRVIYAADAKASAKPPAAAAAFASPAPASVLAPTPLPSAAYAPGAFAGQPPLYDVRSSPHRSHRSSIKALWIPSLIVWSTTYVATVAVTAGIVATEKSSNAAVVGESAIPFAGPWVMIADPQNHMDQQAGRMASTAISGVFQDICLLGFILGVSIHTGGGDEAKSRAPRLSASPVLAPGYSGFTASLTHF